MTTPTSTPDATADASPSPTTDPSKEPATPLPDPPSSSPTPATVMDRVAGTVKQIGEQLIGLATDLDSASALPTGGLDAASARAQLVELVRAVLTDLGLLTPTATSPGTTTTPAGTSTTAPGTSTSGAGTTPGAPTTTTPSTPSTEDTMPLLFRDVAYAHARVAMDGDSVTVESATGFARTAYTATKPPTVACHPDIPVAAAPDHLALPPNTRLVRLELSADHQIDPKEVAAFAAPADRETAYGYEVTAIPVGDRTLDVAVRSIHPDTNAPRTVARFNVMLFRVA